jgi:hypothetical protein
MGLRQTTQLLRIESSSVFTTVVTYGGPFTPRGGGVTIPSTSGVPALS